jgi:hypothetical protein
MDPLFPRQPSADQEIQTTEHDQDALNSTLSSPNKVDIDDMSARVAERAGEDVTPAKIGLSVFIVVCFFALVLAGLALALYALLYYA